MAELFSFPISRYKNLTTSIGFAAKNRRVSAILVCLLKRKTDSPVLRKAAMTSGGEYYPNCGQTSISMAYVKFHFLTLLNYIEIFIKNL